jgi:hypothetical protein
MKEIWKDIEGFEGIYQASSFGNIKSLKRGGKLYDRILKPAINHSGYYIVVLCKNGIMYAKILHRIIAKTFIPNPLNKPTVNHINGIKTDNRIENFEWATRKEQSIHSYSKLPNTNQLETHHKAKLKNKDIPKIFEMNKNGVSHKDISKIYNVHPSQICRIINGKRWKQI